MLVDELSVIAWQNGREEVIVHSSATPGPPSPLKSSGRPLRLPTLGGSSLLCALVTLFRKRPMKKGRTVPEIVFVFFKHQKTKCPNLQLLLFVFCTRMDRVALQKPGMDSSQLQTKRSNLGGVDTRGTKEVGLEGGLGEMEMEARLPISSSVRLVFMLWGLRRGSEPFENPTGAPCPPFACHWPLGKRGNAYRHQLSFNAEEQFRT